MTERRGKENIVATLKVLGKGDMVSKDLRATPSGFLEEAWPKKNWAPPPTLTD